MIDPAWAFLNHGSFGARPRAVLATQRAWRDQFEAHPIRFLDEVYSQPRIEAALRVLARFLKCDAQGLAFQCNVTDAVAVVLDSVELGPGDEVLTTSHAYGAVKRAIEARCRRWGAKPRIVTLPCPLEGPEQVVELVAAAISARTKLAIIDQITSPTALRLPVDALIALCRSKGVPVFVDGAHAGGMLPAPVPKGATWWATNLHKWAMAPLGCALLHTSRAWRGRTRPLAPSHAHFGSYTDAFAWQGTRDISPWLTAPESIDWVRRNGGWASLRRHNAQLASWAGDQLRMAWGTCLSAPESLREGLSMVTVRLPADARAWREPLTLRDALADQFQVEAPMWATRGRWWVRLSLQAYSRPAHVQRLLDGLNHLIEQGPADD
ncbi:MAG: aminotransferase class V-fold PLP-dependent enzyme [Phycisphaerales bacterium]|nr:aminotransferase class V-fold PLP-dependent enzyme [Phycisphaerales bacterium]